MTPSPPKDNYFVNPLKASLLRIIRVYDSSDTLFYIDPPYIGREKYYAGGFTDQDHRD
jgi:site-specific DNA-adenine methylase